ncbi:autotransporter-associated beta strand repeat-containing protein [Luteolibacter ambystomatis]|uniref:Autotransporter-associated beta strand repeat-containing protein n=1 Tax=Luteolibacter ambystomatis TaxID=2824561 RepID=A0A975G5T7_9BACT|nr:autotransporter-associated beta strand repeat-containing protein [Luteolibacter ambystomatis]QUE49328.1 autotransporter-associated beta strand repeat-containing protein [Luteolibacter ambystomatis]
MKILAPFQKRPLQSGLPLFITIVSCLSAHGATITRLNNASTLDLPAAWNGGVVPTSADIAQWTNAITATGSGVGVAANVSFGGMLMQNTTNITVAASGGTLTLAGISGTGIDMTGATANLTINAPVTLGASQSWLVPTGRTLTNGGGIGGGASALTFTGLGSVALNSSNPSTYTGATTFNGVNVNISYPALTSGLSSSTQMITSGATVRFTTGTNNTYTQNLSGLQVNPGWSYFDQFRNSGGRMVTNFGPVTRGGVGATASITNSNNSSTVSGTTASTNGIIGGWLVWANNAAATNPTDFPRGAATAGTLTTFAAPTYTTDTWGGTTNTNVTLASNTTYDNVTTNSLRFAAAQSSTVNLSGTNTISSGGILVSGAVATGFANVITGGTLKGAAGADLVVHQFGQGTTSLAINSIIADNTSTTALTKAGPGLLTLGGANTFTGGIYLNQGELRLTTGGTFNGNALTFTNNSSGILTTGGVDGTIGAVNTSPILAATLPVLQNASATPATLTISAGGVGTFAGNIQDGTGGGALGIAKSGTFIQSLTGTLTYTGPTTVTNGTLFTKNSIASSKAITVTSPGVLDVSTPGLTLLSGNSLGGTGSVTGTVTAGAGTSLIPGGTGTIGTLTVDTLNLSSGATVNVDLGTGSSSDQIHVNGALTLGASQVVNLGLAGPGAMTPGNTYTLFTAASIANFSPSSFTVASGALGGLTYTFASTGTAITMTIGGSLAQTGTWSSSSGGSWGTAGNWTGGTIPNATGDTANFGNVLGGSSMITLDGDRTVAALNLNSPLAYIFLAGSGGNLIFNNGTGTANLTDTSVPAVPGDVGQIIATGVTLASNTIATISSGETLVISGAIDGTGSLTKAGAGMLDLQVPNTYSGGTIISGGGTLAVVGGGLGTGSLSFLGGTLRYTAGNTDDYSISRTVTFNGQAVFDTNGNDVALSQPVGNNGAGGFVKAGTGTLSLPAANTYTGANVVNGGTLRIGSDLSLGQVPSAAGTNLTLAAGTTLITDGAFTLAANRGIVLSGGIVTLDTGANAITIAGATSGSGLFHKAGSGNLTLTGTSTANGGVTIDGGTVFIGGTVNLPTGAITLNGTGGISTGSAAANFGTVIANGTHTIAKTGSSNILGLGTVTGSGAITLSNAWVTDLTGTLTGFSGTITASGVGFRFNGTGGGTNLTLNLGSLGGFVRLAGPSGGTITIGQLIGTGGVLSGGGGGYTGAAAYTIGGKTVGGFPVDSSFGGVFANGASAALVINKVGASTLTLSGVNTYTGNTNVNEGGLILPDNGALAFKPGANGVTNSVTGTISGSVMLDGDFNIDTTGAALANGNTWTLVNRTALGSVTFGANFTVTGFTENANVWTKVDGSNTWTFDESTGVLTLTVAGYASWATAQGLTGAPGFESGAGDDPDHDGILNLLEYVLGGNPLASSSGVTPHLAVNPTSYVFTFTRNTDSKSDVTLNFEYGTGLSAWTAVAIGAANSGPDANGVTINVAAGSPETITVTVPRTLSGSGKLFGRLKATK